MEAGIIVVRQRTFQSRVLLLDLMQRRVDLDGNVRLLRVLHQECPPATLRNVEHVVLRVERHHFQKRFLSISLHLFTVLVKTVIRVLQEEHRQHYMLVFCRFNLTTQLIRGIPKDLLHRFLFFRLCFSFRHDIFLRMHSLGESLFEDQCSVICPDYSTSSGKIQ